MLSQLKNDLARLENKDKAKQFLRFFKTGKDEYGEGDKFLGITVPEQRSIAKNYLNLSLQDLQKLLQSKIHEHRLTALIILVAKYKKGGQDLKRQIIDLYLKNTKNINNWDLVDLSAPYILGNFLLDKERKILYKLAHSKNLWKRRIAMLSSFEFIKNNEFKDTLKIARTLLNDKHDLIHKAIGWMLREVGKRDQKVEEGFLKKYYKIMPRTALRYAIEKLPPKKKQFYLKK